MRKINWRYAIGELIIITIGISLAFALNNWAAKKADERKLDSYMENIKSELEEDLSQLDSNISIIGQRLEFMNNMIPHLHAEIPGRAEAANGIYGIIDPVPFRRNATTWQSLTYSGEIQLIRDLELRNALIRHYETYELVEEEYLRHYNYSKDYMAPFFMKEVNYATMATQNYPHLSDNYFRNLMFALRGIYNNELQAHIKARESIVKVLEKI